MGPHNGTPRVPRNLKFRVPLSPEKLKRSNLTKKPALFAHTTPPKENVVFRNAFICASPHRRAPPACCDQGMRPPRPDPSPLILGEPGAAPPQAPPGFMSLPTSPPPSSPIYLAPGKLTANQEFTQTTARELVPASDGLLPWHPDTQLPATGMHSDAKKKKTGEKHTHTHTFQPPFLIFST